MEGNFERRQIKCLKPVLHQVQNSEQTLEIKLPETMPDVGQVLTAWGQPILRSKEWRDDTLQFSGGMMVWVLYVPVDGTEEQCVHGWIPFQLRWDLPEDTREGVIRFRFLPRFVDSRNTSARKLMVRAGLAVLAEAYSPDELETALPGPLPEDVALLQNTYPLRLIKEAGEKTFVLEESLRIPDAAPDLGQLVCWQVTPRISEQRIQGDKAVIKGSGSLHILYRSSSGQLHSWDFEVPFSQYTDLQGEYGADAKMELALVPTSLDLDLGENGELLFRGGFAAQFLIADKQPVVLAEDAYSPRQELTVCQEELTVPVILENRLETLHEEQMIPVKANIAVDTRCFPDFPRIKQTQSGLEVEIPGQSQIVYYDENGKLQSSVARFTGKQNLQAADNTSITAIPQSVAVQTAVGEGSLQLKLDLSVEVISRADQRLSMVTSVTLGERKPLDSNRPSLILQRAGGDRLWDIAKATGSTVEAIRSANALSGEPSPNQMLLIPVN